MTPGTVESVEVCIELEAEEEAGESIEALVAPVGPIAVCGVEDEEGAEEEKEEEEEEEEEAFAPSPAPAAPFFCWSLVMNSEGTICSLC